MSKIKILLAIVCVLSLSAKGIAQEITLGSLLQEMADRSSLARLPDPAFTVSQASSYDRRSTAPGNEDWFANDDRSQFIRTDSLDGRREFVMMDEKGPGAIVRFWMTFAGKDGGGHGTLRVYLNGEPVISGDARMLLGLGALVGFPLADAEPAQVNYQRRGYDLYLPIAYAKSCKITYQSEALGHKDPGKNDAVYYNIDYRSYNPEAQVETFKMKHLQTYHSELVAAKDFLIAYPFEEKSEGQKTETKSEDLAAGAEMSFDLTGNRAVDHIHINLDAENLDQALRSTLLTISFDGEQTVWSPIGDFFGTGYRLSPVDNFYTKVDANGNLDCFWVMPFRESAQITIKNEGDQKVKIMEASITHRPWQWTEKDLHFGALWQQYAALNTTKDGKRFDVNFTTLKGKGYYVGDVLTLYNTVSAWWGEGDEKIYVDGEKFPSHFGTGSEDYYGYAWSQTERFSGNPFIGQPDGEGVSNPGYVVNLRFRALDAIPFTKSLKMDMEMWHWSKNTKIDYAPTTFFYMRPGGQVLVDKNLDQVRRKVTENRADLITINDTVNGKRFEMESARVSDDSENAGAQFNEDWGWSGDSQVFWRPHKKGETLNLEFQNKNAKKTLQYLNLTKAPDYGKFTIKLNDKTLIDNWNGYNKNGVITEKVKTKLISLKTGTNTMEVIYNDTAPNLDIGYFGIDYLEFDQ